MIWWKVFFAVEFIMLAALFVVACAYWPWAF
jgi:hypothetical protein